MYRLWTPLQALRAEAAPPRSAASLFIPRYPITNILLPHLPPLQLLVLKQGEN